MDLDKLLMAEGNDDLAKYLDNQTEEEYSNLLERVGGGGNNRATVDSIDTFLGYVNRTLSNLGYDAPITLPTRTLDEAVRAVNVVQSLLEQRQKDIDGLEEAREKYSRLDCDYRSLHVNFERKVAKEESLEREISTLTLRERNLATTLKAEKEKFKSEKHELNTQILNLRQRDTQFQHELRKKEREYAKLQSRLDETIKNRDREWKAGMNIASAIQSGARGSWKTPGAPNHMEQMHAKVVESLEDRVQSLQRENEAMRQTISKQQAQLEELFEVNKHILARAEREDNDEIEGLLTPGQLQLPFHMVRDQLQEAFNDRVRKLQEAMSVVSNDENDLFGVNDADVVKERVRELRSIIKEQDRLIQMSLLYPDLTSGGTPGQRNGSFSDSRIGDIETELTERKALLEEKERHISQERAELVEAMAALTRERDELESQRQAFHRNKVAGYATPHKIDGLRSLTAHMTPGTKLALGVATPPEGSDDKRDHFLAPTPPSTSPYGTHWAEDSGNAVSASLPDLAGRHTPSSSRPSPLHTSQVLQDNTLGNSGLSMSDFVVHQAGKPSPKPSYRHL